MLADLFFGLSSRSDDVIGRQQANNIPFVKLEGAPFYTQGGFGPHWTPEGQKVVADRILGLLSANHIIQTSATAPAKE